MPLAQAVIAFDASDYGSVDFDPRRTKVYATNNVPGGTIVDTLGNHLFLGSGNGTINPDGSGSISLPIPGTGSNPATWQTTIHFDYPDRNAPSGRGKRSFGPFTITASADLADLVLEQEIPPVYLTTVTDLLDGYVDSAAAAATAAAASATSAAASAALAGGGGGGGGGGGTGTGVDPDDVGFDIILLAGQSNMVGTNTGYDAKLDPVDGRIWQYPGLTSSPYYGKVIQAQDNLLHPAVFANGVGPGMPFARRYASSVAPNRRVLLVPMAWSGSAFTNTTNCWKTDGSGSNNLYTAAKNRVLSALALHPKNRVTAILWLQGESDTTLTQTQYATELDALIDGFRTAFSKPALPFVIGQMVPEWYPVNGTGPAINAAHVNTPNRKAYTGFAYGPTSMNDDIHYNAAGARELGSRMFDAYRTATTNSLTTTPPTGGAPGQVTGLTTGTLTSTTVPLSWTAVTGATSYLVEYKATSSGTWLTGPTTTAANGTVTGLTGGTSYDFRVSAINSSGTGTPSSIVTATPPAAVSSYATAVLADTPLAYWRMGEASGTTALDSTGNGRTGTYIGGPTLGATSLVTGDSNTSVDLDGVNDRIDFTYAAWQDVDYLTVEAIIKPDVVNVEQLILARDASPRMFQFRINNDGKLTFFWFIGGTPFFATASTALTAGTRYHVAGTYDGTTGRLYINGAQVASATSSGVLNKGATALVVGGASGGSLFNGLFDEAAYYGTALSAARVLDHAQKAGLA